MLDEGKKRWTAWRKKIAAAATMDLVIIVTALCLAVASAVYLPVAPAAKGAAAAMFALIALYYGWRLWRIAPPEPEEKPTWKSRIHSIVLINESGTMLKEWSVRGKVALCVGKTTPQKEVDIDLSECMFDVLVHEEHALINYAGGDWYVEGLHTPSGISIKKANDSMRYRLAGDKPCRLEPGDTLYIAKTRLLMK